MIWILITIFGITLIAISIIEIKRIIWIFKKNRHYDKSKILENMYEFKFRTLQNSGNEKIDLSNEQIYDDSRMQIKYKAICNPPGKVQFIYKVPEYVERESI